MGWASQLSYISHNAPRPRTAMKLSKRGDSDNHGNCSLTREPNQKRRMGAWGNRTTDSTGYHYSIFHQNFLVFYWNVSILNFFPVENFDFWRKFDFPTSPILNSASLAIHPFTLELNVVLYPLWLALAIAPLVLLYFPAQRQKSNRGWIFKTNRKAKDSHYLIAQIQQMHLTVSLGN